MSMLRVEAVMWNPRGRQRPIYGVESARMYRVVVAEIEPRNGDVPTRYGTTGLPFAHAQPQLK